MTTAKPFEELNIPRKQQPDIVGKYRVYGAAGECIEIAANTVIEALESSGVQNPVKVERALLSSIGIFPRGKLGSMAAQQAQPEATQPPAAT